MTVTYCVAATQVPLEEMVAIVAESIKTNRNKKDEEFRVYCEEKSERRVVEHYRDMRRYQTVEFYRRMEKKYTFENGQHRALMTIDEAFDELEQYIVSWMLILCSCYSEACLTDCLNTFL